jgi:hypothetical protein
VYALIFFFSSLVGHGKVGRVASVRLYLQSQRIDLRGQTRYEELLNDDRSLNSVELGVVDEVMSRMFGRGRSIEW